MIRRLELLAPAKTAEYGVVAIDYGADAVYIGAPKFGARAAAGNAMEEIERLAGYAHRFGARVYLALNTVLYDSELAEAEAIARRAWEAGVDALIVQDMALAEMNLPIPLHASTQTFNLSPEKAAFMGKAGFSRLILERAASLDEIRAIREATSAELEVFVHGAICVGYSGQCYLSRTVSGRSGNRGDCMQPCRWDYNLTGDGFQRLATAKHLLSVGDLNLSEQLSELIEVGVCSFKIEGRLKDATYLKNSVAFYRQKLDEIIARRTDLARSSDGETAFDFVPDPEKSFTRGFTTYYLLDPKNRVASFDTPKSIGRFVGTVSRVAHDSFTLNRPAVRLTGGDGLCFVSGGRMLGTNVNRAEGDKVYPNRMEGLAPGVHVYRNYDHAFVQRLDRSRTRRTIALAAQVSVGADRLTLRLSDGAGNAVERSVGGAFEVAHDPARAEETIDRQIAKTGETIFRIERIDHAGDVARFVPAAVLNGLRREALAALEQVIQQNYRRPERQPRDPSAVYPEQELDYRANVTNRLSEQFYRRHGVTVVEPGLDLQGDPVGREVMRTKYCIRREMGQCLREHSCAYTGSMQLENNFHRFALRFDCAKCEMSLIYKGQRDK
ncbi:MAG: U32 family peptidase [Rikenellaceae bacterium]|jgi:putative protease|nr:U32 family peptidase [Rikenellaceae bacterium]